MMMNAVERGRGFRMQQRSQERLHASAHSNCFGAMYIVLTDFAAELDRILRSPSRDIGKTIGDKGLNLRLTGFERDIGFVPA
jgi:hypothetical protein